MVAASIFVDLSIAAYERKLGIALFWNLDNYCRCTLAWLLVVQHSGQRLQ